MTGMGVNLDPGMSNEQLSFVVRWAAQYGALVSLAGEVGFGRPCVGILVDGSYIDYSYDDRIWTPDDAYHKHECLAVLGHGEKAEDQLYEWVQWLADNGWSIETTARQPKDNLDLIFHGISASRLVQAVGNHR